MNWNPTWEFETDDPALQLRLRPLREHWEARGPGLLSRVQQTYPWIELPSQITITLIDPQRGGGGRVLGSNHIEFEAVLFNPMPQLPEVVRLAWLWGCCDATTRDGLSASLIPVVLEAAQHVELASFDEVTTKLAIENWLDQSNLTPARLIRWYEHSGRHAKTVSDLVIEDT